MVVPGDIREGMTVRTADGQAVGKVAAVGDVHFELEKGLVPIPRKDYLVEFSDVSAVRGHDVFLEEGAAVVLEEDDDGSALPPRRHANVDAEPVNTENPPH